MEILISHIDNNLGKLATRNDAVESVMWLQIESLIAAKTSLRRHDKKLHGMVIELNNMEMHLHFLYNNVASHSTTLTYI